MLKGVRACSVVSEPARPLCPWDFPGKNTGVGSHFLLQAIFPTQGWNLCLGVSWIGRWILYTPEPSKKPSGKGGNLLPASSRGAGCVIASGKQLTLPAGIWGEEATGERCWMAARCFQWEKVGLADKGNVCKHRCSTVCMHLILSSPFGASSGIWFPLMIGPWPECLHCCDSIFDRKRP